MGFSTVLPIFVNTFIDSARTGQCGGLDLSMAEETGKKVFRGE